LGIIGWIVLGLIVGYIASTLMNKRREGVSSDILLGVVGAVMGGWVFNAAGVAGPTGFNTWSHLVAVIGAVLVLVVWHVIRGSARHA